MSFTLDDETVYLIDGSGYIFRAYFAVRPLNSKAGVPTNAVYGFTSMLLKLLKQHKPKYLAIAFDRKEKTFRHELYPAYKANRPEPPKDLIPQFELIQNVVDCFNIKRLDLAGFEADDLLGTAARQLKDQGRKIVIVSGDKDLMQLVDEQTMQLDELRASRNGTEELIDKDAVKEQLGVWPHQVVDLLAMAGDSSDNVPGIAGIGKKTAVELINEFGPLERIFQMAPLIKQNARRQKLIDGQKMGLLSKELVSINLEAPINLRLEDLLYQGINQEKTKELFTKLDFHRLLQDQSIFSSMPQKTANPAKEEQFHIEHIKSPGQLSIFIQSIKNKNLIGLFAHYQKENGALVGLSLAWSKSEGAFIDLANQNGQISAFLLEALLFDETHNFACFDAKQHYKIFLKNNLKALIKNDPLLQNYLLEPEGQKHNLLSLWQKYFPENILNEISAEALPEFGHRQAWLSFELTQILDSKIKEQDLSALYNDIEMPLARVLAIMEENGVKVDVEKLNELGLKLKTRLADLEKKAHDFANKAFNLASPKQVGQILFEDLGLKNGKKTKTGYSTEYSVLEKLTDEHPIIRVLLEHRTLAKLINTYLDTLPALVDPKTRRVHTSYNQATTATGRLSSSEPNLQNIPARTEIGRKIREAFIAEPGKVIISLDYSQVELRLLAHVSQEPSLLSSFANDEDVHKRTASEIFGLKLEEVSKEQRNAAKTINFGLLYGMGPHKLAQTLNISRAQADDYLKKYFAKYPKLLAWKDKCIELARKTLEVRTLLGRKRALPELEAKNKMLQARAERLAINTPIQGTAADIIKIAMIQCQRLLERDFPGSLLIMQVHDELVLEVPKDQARDIAKKIAQIMSQAHGLKLDVELKVEHATGANWELAH